MVKTMDSKKGLESIHVRSIGDGIASYSRKADPP